MCDICFQADRVWARLSSLFFIQTTNTKVVPPGRATSFVNITIDSWPDIVFKPDNVRYAAAAMFSWLQRAFHAQYFLLNVRGIWDNVTRENR